MVSQYAIALSYFQFQNKNNANTINVYKKIKFNYNLIFNIEIYSNFYNKKKYTMSNRQKQIMKRAYKPVVNQRMCDMHS
jgi:hypothetical protein